MKKPVFLTASIIILMTVSFVVGMYQGKKSVETKPVLQSDEKKEPSISNSSVKEERTVVFKANGQGFLNPHDKRQVETGEYVHGLINNSNILLVSSDGKSTRFLFDQSEYTSLLFSALNSNRRGENKPIPYFAVNPIPVSNGKKIAFLSNKDTMLSPKSTMSIRVIDIDPNRKNEKVLIDGRQYGNVNLIDSSGNWVLAEDAEKHSILLANAETNEVKEYPIDGEPQPQAFSKDGSYVLFQKFKDHQLIHEVWMLDLKTGKEIKIGLEPSDYFFTHGVK